ncbi:sorting nexin-7 [Brachionichthys hirsutus]|uniref:sorting nexin-7 n=1 Tax=Brachionichthys hirsutus TaxID=412623 RepID=UPI00360470DC
MDLLRLRLNTYREMRDCCVLLLTETWLNNSVPDSAVQIDGLLLFRADRNHLSGKTRGGGLCVYINRGWCTNCSVVSSHCSEAVEHLTIRCRPHYLPREFTAVFVVAVYIPPSANANEALRELHDNIGKQQHKHPEALYVVAGDFNHVNLTDILPRFHQHVNIATRGNNTLDRVYTNRKDSYRATPRPHLGLSDHISIMLVPSYRPVCRSTRPTQKSTTVWPGDAASKLQDCFERTEWQIFREAATYAGDMDLEEYTSSVLGFISKCVEDTLWKVGEMSGADMLDPDLDLDPDPDGDEDLEVFSQNKSLAEGSPNSPISIINQYRLNEEEEQQQDVNIKDLVITVDHPESQVSAIETFIMYRVVTKTSRSEFNSSEYEVRRRYQDFLWLRSRLEENHPTLIVHPLPEKFVMKGMVERFNDDFIDTRRKALHRFLNKISEHPILSCNPHFKVFLTSQELLSHRKQASGFLSRMGDTVRAVANSVRYPRSRPEEFTVMQDYVEDFRNKMSSVDKVSQRIVKEQREYLEELKQYSPAYTRWAESEEQTSDPLRGVASCVERCREETGEQIHHLSENLVPVLRECVLCAETVKAVMRRRDSIQAEFEAKNEVRVHRNTDQEALQEEVESLANQVELANNALKEDWLRWQNSLRTDLKSAFISTSEKNIESYEKCRAIWESFLLSQRVESIQQSDGEDST